ncbi:MAG: ABC transporter ATP-binding protein [Lachnospiraceae bacterium]|nr:ABC transporter ATP-binding protein [Lachnospiraceae bacterium]
MKSELLSVSNLEKSYGERKVVNAISFSILNGEILGFLGPNGAGKSTSIRTLVGIEKFDGGTLSYQGKIVDENRREMKKEIGLVPQDIAVYGDLSAYDNVRFFCSLYGYHGKELDRRVKEALEFVALWDRRKEKPGRFSGGMKRRLNIACSIAHSPKLLILDEPTVGIDPQSRNYILEAIRILNKRGTTVIYVSHYMEEIEALCNRIIIMDEGKIKEDLSKDELMEKYNNQGFETLEEIFLEITGKKLRDRSKNE